MHRGWICDLEKAIKALREATRIDMFCAVCVNPFGDFMFRIDYDNYYIVKHDDFSVVKVSDN